MAFQAPKSRVVAGREVQPLRWARSLRVLDGGSDVDPVVGIAVAGGVEVGLNVDKPGGTEGLVGTVVCARRVVRRLAAFPAAAVRRQRRRRRSPHGIWRRCSIRWHGGDLLHTEERQRQQVRL